MKKIKVMHFVAGLTSGGVEQMLCNYCGAMNKDAYEFVLAYQHQAVETCKEKIEESGCRTIRITARSENFIKNLIDGYRVIKKERPDIVHAHMNLVNFCALLPAYLLGVKVRISHSHIAETNRNILFRIMAAICKFLCVHAATDLMTCGQEAGIYLYGKRRMQKGKVLLVENAINGMFISCIVIVLHHSVGDVFYDVGIWGGVIEYLHEGLFSFSMPFFFFWSGYFMMQKAQKEDIQHIISTKMRSLVIPYFAWNTIWTLFAVMLALIPLNIFSKSAVLSGTGKQFQFLKELHYISITGNTGICFS